MKLNKKKQKDIKKITKPYLSWIAKSFSSSVWDGQNKILWRVVMAYLSTVSRISSRSSSLTPENVNVIKKGKLEMETSANQKLALTFGRGSTFQVPRDTLIKPLHLFRYFLDCSSVDFVLNQLDKWLDLFINDFSVMLGHLFLSHPLRMGHQRVCYHWAVFRKCCSCY